MRQTWILLATGLAMCALLPALPSVGSGALHLAGSTPLSTPSERLLENTFYLTEGIAVSQRLMPLEKGVSVSAAPALVPGVGVTADGDLYGTPRRSGTYTAPISLCGGGRCAQERITLVVLGYVPWNPGVLTFPGKVGQRLDGRIEIEGGPAGVLPTFTVTALDALPPGASIGPDGEVGGVPSVAGVFRVPVRICVAGDCGGAVVTLIIV